MRIILAPYGSRGDVSPAIALGAGLSKRGHDVLICGPPEAASLARNHSCNFEPIGSSVREFSNGIAEPALHVFRATAQVTAFLKREFQIQLKQQLELFQGADLIFGASLNFAAPTAAEKNGASYRFLAYCPQLLPSRQYPPVLFRSQRLPDWWNRISWKTNAILWNRILVPFINTERDKLGLQPVKDFNRYWLGKHVLLACDPLLSPVPQDVTYPHTQVGFVGIAGSEVAHPAGETPAPQKIYAGFGSMRHERPNETTQILLNAVHAAGRHAVISAGWSDLGANLECANCEAIGETSHSDLFPKVAAVIHHGGSGTTATAARAGIPQVIVPHITDQFYWAHQVQRLGIGPVSPWRSNMSESNLRRAIATALQDGYAIRAKKVSQQLRQEDPLSRAIELIESPSFIS